MKIKNLLLLTCLCTTLFCEEKISVDQLAQNISHQFGKKSLDQMQQIFVNALAQLIKDDITQAIEQQLLQEKRPLKELTKSLIEQDVVSTIAKQALELLKAFEKELKTEKKEAKKAGDKKQEKDINKKEKKVRDARHFLSLANKYLDKETKQIEKLLAKAKKDVNRNLDAAKLIIEEIINPTQKA